MRIALVHSYYADEGLSGENVTVDQQADLLRAAGHRVAIVGRRTVLERQRPMYTVRSAARVATGLGADPSAELAAFDPDVVHVHNLFPNFGTSWLRSWRGPLVATLHNFRTACANGLLLRDGAQCRECPDRSSWSGIRHACYHGSRLATAPLAWSTRHGATAAALVRRADRLVCPAEHSRDLFVELGIGADRIDVIPHGLEPRHRSAISGPDRPRYLFVGRLSPEKGLARMLAHWPPGDRLDVIGDGPDAGPVPARAACDVRFLGSRDESWRADAPGYTALVAPGLAIEAAVPRVAVEAWEAGLPVVARAGAGAAFGVAATGAGVVYERDADLPDALARAHAHGFPLRERARRAYESGFTPDRWTALIEQAYDRARHRVRP